MTQTTNVDAAVSADQDLDFDFLVAIQQLYESNRGRIAVLKRNYGNTLAEARGLVWFEYYLLRLPKQSRRQDNLCLLIASLMTFDKKTMLKGVKRGGGDFGKTLASLRPQTATDNRGKKDQSSDNKSTILKNTPLERRLVLLLDATFDEDGGGEMAFRLGQAVKFVLAKNREAAIDWPQLLKDMRAWDHPDKYVQKHWARSFYTPDYATAVPTDEAGAETLIR